MGELAFIVSTGCSKEVESAHARPPANADLRTLPADISTGGATATTVAASNHILLFAISKRGEEKLQMIALRVV